MHDLYNNLLSIKNEIKKNFINKSKIKHLPEVIAVSKTFSIEHIKPIIDSGHLHFGENKVQEAELKWQLVKKNNPKIKLHLIGRLQTNKVKNALKIFDYVHSLDSYKLAETISKYNNKLKVSPEIFVQVNIGNEQQKNGINILEIKKFVDYCKNSLSLNVIGLMCLPPINEDPCKYFLKMKILKNEVGLDHLSMGMTSDYSLAIKYDSTFLRIGTKIFGKR